MYKYLYPVIEAKKRNIEKKSHNNQRINNEILSDHNQQKKNNKKKGQFQNQKTLFNS